MNPVNLAVRDAYASKPGFSDERPPGGAPEFKKWLEEKAKKAVDGIFGEDYTPADFDERGPIFGNPDNLDKSDADLFPDELEEHTPEERRKKFKLYQGKQDTDDGDDGNNGSS